VFQDKGYSLGGLVMLDGLLVCLFKSAQLKGWTTVPGDTTGNGGKGVGLGVEGRITGAGAGAGTRYIACTTPAG